jgi:hypothetical protein
VIRFSNARALALLVHSVPSALVFTLAVAVSILPVDAGAAGPRPVAITADDMDGDPLCPGCSDLVVADAGTGEVTISFGQGDGTFTAPLVMALGARPVSVAIGDCDGDGDLDLFAPTSRRGIAVYLNQQQDGSPRVFELAASSPLQIADRITLVVARDADGQVLDIDNDGALDLVALQRGKTAVVLHSDGACAFGGPQLAYGRRKKVGGLAVGDFDSDGDPDLIVNERKLGAVIMVNNELGGGFVQGELYTLGGKPTSLTSADLTGDGIPDVIGTYAKNELDPNTLGVGVLRANAGTGLENATAYGAGGAKPAAAVVGNFDGTGDVDVVVVNQRDSTLAFLSGEGNGVLGAPLTSATPGMKPSALSSGDFNGDGRVDVVVLNRASKNLSFCLGDGAGAFSCSLY